MLAKQFVDKHPSKTGNIINYGDEFSVFIKAHDNCKTLPYLGDVARFERLYERCYFSLDGVFFMTSLYPIIEIWQLDDNSEQLDFTNQPVYLRVFKQGAEVLVEKITQQQYEERQ
jgi:hypothetical protein